MSFPCPRCRTAASNKQGRTSGNTTKYRQYVCLPAHGGCGLVMNTHEVLVRNKALEAQLTAEQLEWMFGKPKFKYKSTPPRR